MTIIELNNFMRAKGLASSGGEAKYLIRSEKVKVNNQIETRLRRKLIGGDKVEFDGKVYEVEKETFK
ncbi:MAG: RNA-binding S4 domain-containing protein [Candidatus Woesearchaeota archaeon]